MIVAIRKATSLAKRLADRRAFAFVLRRSGYACSRRS